MAVLAALVVVYSPALHGDFVFDDFYLPFWNEEVVDLPLRHWLSGVRPLLILTYWINFQLSGTDSFSYHLVNLFLHFGNGLLLFWIARRYLEWSGESGSRGEILAAFAAGLFLFHPVQSEAVSYIAGRSESLAVLFSFAALLLFLQCRDEEISWSRAGGILALLTAAMLVKEHTVVLPLLFLLTEVYWSGLGPRQWLRVHWKLYAALSVGAVASVVMIVLVLLDSKSAGFGLPGLTWYEYLFTQFRTVWVYLRFFVWPAGQNVDHAFPFSLSLFDQGSLWGLLALAAAMAAALALRRRFRLASYGFLTFLLFLAPTSSILPLLDALVERRLYFPMLGLLLVTTDLLRRWRISAPVLGVALGAVLLAQAAVCYQRNHVWRDAIALWEDAVSKSPHNARAQFQLAHAYYQAGDCQSSADHYQESVSLTPGDITAHVNWALALDCLGQPDQAVAKLEQGASRLAADPRQSEDTRLKAHLYSQLGMIHGKHGRAAAAREALNEALRSDATYSLTYVYLGHLEFARNELGKAAEYYRRALELNPRNELAKESLERLGRSP